MTTTSMQFGQSAINVVIGEGQVPAKLATDASGNVSLVGASGVPVPLFGNRLMTVGAGGQYATLAEAVAAAGSRWVVSKDMGNLYVGPWPDKQPFTATFTNGSASFSYVSGKNFFGNSGLTGGEFVSIGGTYYRVKDVSSTTAGTLYGTFKGTTGNYTCTPMLLDWVTILLLPGAHSAYQVQLQPGMCLAGFSKESTSIVEDGAAESFSFAPMTKLSNLSLEPNTLFGSMDRMAYYDANAGGAGITSYGCEVRIDKCKVVNGNERGPHAGGNIQWPVIAGGLFAFTNSELGFCNDVGAIGMGGESGVVSKLLFDNITTRWTKGISNPQQLAIITDIFNVPGGPIQIDVINCFSDLEDFAFNPTNGASLAAFKVSQTGVTLTISGGEHRIVNNNAAAAAGEFPAIIDCSGSAVVNVRGGAVLEATGSTVSGANQGTAIYNNGGTVNVQAGARVKGDTNKAINNAAGTVNVSPNADVIGGTTGVITSAAT